MKLLVFLQILILLLGQKCIFLIKNILIIFCMGWMKESILSYIVYGYIL
jgi:hypothetical protein